MSKLDENPNDFKCCKDCKHFYNLDFSYDGYHNICSIGICYLCNSDDCIYYEKGETPTKRGGWKY